MDETIKDAIIAFIDNFVVNIEDYNDKLKNRIIRMGIEPTLETMLAHLGGHILGITSVRSSSLYGKTRDVDMNGALDELEKRAWIIREALLKSRFK